MFHQDHTQFDVALVEPLLTSETAVSGGDAIARFLHSARRHLNLHVAYVSEIVGNESIFRHVDAPGLEHLVQPGDRRSLDDVYCRHILEGRLPQLIPDTALEPLAMSMPITAAVPIGAHVSVPLRLADGALYGMFCCLGPAADPTLNPRDLDMMRMLADLAAQEIQREQAAARSLAARRAPIEAMLQVRAFAIMYQPIWRLGTAEPVGFESLTRFRSDPYRAPDLWFADAHAVGLGEALELVTIDAALGALDQMPPPAYITVNASPSTACSPALHRLLSGRNLARLVLEITEQERFEDYATLAAAIEPLRSAGMRVAVDDAGTGYAGLQQILQIKPDIIKLDRFFVRAIHRDPSRRALAAALAVFAAEVGSVMVAEGVEEADELDTLRSLGFSTIQGYLLGKPAPMHGAIGLLGGVAGADNSA